MFYMLFLCVGAHPLELCGSSVVHTHTLTHSRTTQHAVHLLLLLIHSFIIMLLRMYHWQFSGFRERFGDISLELSTTVSRSSENKRMQSILHFAVFFLFSRIIRNRLRMYHRHRSPVIVFHVAKIHFHSHLTYHFVSNFIFFLSCSSQPKQCFMHSRDIRSM